MAQQSNGLFVTCHAWAPGKKSQPHEVSRSTCLAQRYDYCPDCPNSQFNIRLKIGIGRETVLCPRWDSEINRIRGQMPNEYVPVPREVCLTSKPFLFCPSCPNSKPQEPARYEEGWYKYHKG